MGNLAIDGGDTVGERIRAAYLAKGMNRSQFVRALGVAYTTVIAWERDEFVPGAENLQAIAAITGVSVDHLLGLDSPDQSRIDLDDNILGMTVAERALRVFGALPEDLVAHLRKRAKEVNFEGGRLSTWVGFYEDEMAAWNARQKSPEDRAKGPRGRGGP